MAPKSAAGTSENEIEYARKLKSVKQASDIAKIPRMLQISRNDLLLNDFKELPDSRKNSTPYMSGTNTLHILEKPK